MEPILLTLAFVGGFTGLIIVGTRVNLYFYSHGAIKVGRSRHMRGLSSIADFTSDCRAPLTGS